MIELTTDRLSFEFPEVHPQAKMTIEFQRTLRIPDNDRDYPLPPGLGRFPLRHVDDYAENLPAVWLKHGGVLLPMYQAEAMWLAFDSEFIEEHDTSYPFAVKVAAGKIDALTGNPFRNKLHAKPQDYMVMPEQPWLDGFCVKKGVVRQFVAMPLGQGFTAEEQITGTAEHGGLQIVVYPMKRAAFERRFPRESLESNRGLESSPRAACFACCDSLAMGLAPGGRMRQEIYADPFAISDWDLEHRSRCFVHIMNSTMWQAATGERPPHLPPTAKEYTQAGLPWFSYYDEQAQALHGSSILSKLKSVAKKATASVRGPLGDEDPTTPKKIIPLGPSKSANKVREGRF